MHAEPRDEYEYMVLHTRTRNLNIPPSFTAISFRLIFFHANEMQIAQQWIYSKIILLIRRI